MITSRNIPSPRISRTHPKMTLDQRPGNMQTAHLARRCPPIHLLPQGQTGKQRLCPASSPMSAPPKAIAQRKWLRAIYGTHPYSRPNEGAKESLAAITQADLSAA